MALSGSFSGSIRRGYSIRVDWTATQDYGANTSTITCKLYMINDYALYIGARTNSITIAGQKFTLSSSAINTTGSHYIGQASKTITHNSDGSSPTVTISAVFNIAATLSGVYFENITASGTAVFNTIPRASRVSLSYASAATIGKTLITIKTNRKSSSFSHTIKFSFEGLSETIATGVTDSYAWTAPEKLYKQIPNRANGNCTITCETYSGSKYIGSSQASLVIWADNERYKPTIINWNIVEGNEAVKKIGLASDEFIDRTSIFKATVKGLATYQYATFKLMLFGVGDAYVEGSSKTEITLNKPSTNASGIANSVLTILDSRGSTGIYNKNVKIYPYSLPLDRTSVQRLNNYEEQTTINPNVEISVFGDKHGTLSYKYRYYQKNASPPDYTDFSGLKLSGNIVTGDAVNLRLDNTKEWTVDLQFSDGLNTVTRSVTVSRGIPLFFMNSETGDLEVYGSVISRVITDTYTENGIAVEIVKCNRICQILIRSDQSKIPNCDAWNESTILTLPVKYRPQTYLIQNFIGDQSEQYADLVNSQYWTVMYPDGRINIACRNKAFKTATSNYSWRFSATYIAAE